ncbi:MAG: ribosome small subunit-dependent GTPase A [Acidimicrobiia bacterium]
MSQTPTDELSRYGWTEEVQSQFDSLPPGALLARVARVDRGSYLIATASGLERCHPAQGERDQAWIDSQPVTGDWVAARPEAGFGLVVEAMLPRRSAIKRLDPSATGEQVLVANVDTMFILHGLDRPHRVGRVERLCLITWDAGAVPVVILTKSDLEGTEDAAIDLLEAIDEVGSVVRDVEIVPVSSTTGAGIHQLAPYLQAGHTVGVVGESGAGKSTLINRLAGDEVQVTGDTREGDSMGKHTTTARHLVPLPSGAVLIDTPGLRAVSMLGDQTGLERSYADVEDLFERCRFRDCSHRAEPGCGVKEALASGELEEARWAGYQRLLRETAFEAARTDARARNEEIKQLSKRIRKSKKNIDEW